ncbi:hypothetical protein LSG31_21735 [Fodinisporobacter ferrooxydans]|uniref:Uncharacterized protein n=1 Tax=Fodinisporobacter ferrooxydans TaxID=2901836 RepID=A0ABY4CJ78_9BACL|nr:hypothetical protein LSG31_21735 [Alicyclobacillaceae bacterium MYW30-H2]
MQEKLNRLQEMFSRLSAAQQDDIINLLETWIKQQQVIKEAPTRQPSIDSGHTSALQYYHHPSLDQQRQSVNILRNYVRDHFRPMIELAYIAFHPDLDSISTAKSRAAVENMFELEAAYELKSILETQPDSSIISKQLIDTFQESNKKNSK